MFRLFGLFIISWMVYDLVMENIIEATVYPHFLVFAAFTFGITWVVTKLMSKTNKEVE